MPNTKQEQLKTVLQPDKEKKINIKKEIDKRTNNDYLKELHRSRDRYRRLSNKFTQELPDKINQRIEKLKRLRGGIKKEIRNKKVKGKDHKELYGKLKEINIKIEESERFWQVINSANWEVIASKEDRNKYIEQSVDELLEVK